MHPLQNCKIAKMLAPIDANGVTATDTEIDTLGWDYLAVVIGAGNVAADMTALTLNESDTASQTGTAFVTFTALTGSGGDGDTVAAFIDLRNARKRYISLVATAGSGASLLCAYGILYRGTASPSSATERGLVEQFIV